MGKRKYDYTPRERMRTCTIVALLAYVLTVMMPSQNVVSQVMMARILSGGTPIEESDGAFPLDWLLLLHRALAQRSTLLAAVAAVLRSEVTKWAKAPYVHGPPTDFFSCPVLDWLITSGIRTEIPACTACVVVLDDTVFSCGTLYIQSYFFT